MKILIVTDAWRPQVNGVVRTYEYLRDELEKRGHEIRVISPADFPFTIPMPGYSEIRLAFMPYARLRKMIDAWAPDHVHIPTEGPLGWAARRYCMKRGADFSTAYHTHFPYYAAQRLAPLNSQAYKFFHRLGRAYVRHFHAPSRVLMVATQSLEDELKSWNFKTPMVRLTRGVSPDLFFPGEKTAFRDLKPPIALYVGRIAIEKNLEDFLSMDWPGSRVVIGDGPSLSYLSGKYPSAHFAGIKTGAELAACYRSADLFVFPSRTDTFGIVLLEALASGLPIAAYDATGPRDIITQSFLGAIDEDLSKAAAKAMSGGDAAARAKHVKEFYSWERAAQQFEAAIKRT